MVLSFVILVVSKLHRLLRSTNKLGIDGSLIWTDQGRNTKPFFNKDFKVLGKPDLMYKIQSGVLAVEYKSRRSRVYLSDTVQAKSAALAARGAGYHVTKILVCTQTQKQYFELPRQDLTLYKSIEVYVSYVREAKSGSEMKATPSRYKCRSCAYHESCQFTV